MVISLKIQRKKMNFMPEKDHNYGLNQHKCCFFSFMAVLMMIDSTD